ncbi:hypothetical protein SAMN05660429_02354 [Thalassotalea agarivorans]|uniref:Uncharacterized protein n=1 Tax=Thalassotalea agarivorans TaxID=349064 RepID=A0A1I0GAI9_THASX|nr:hypothetical protein SAMN05660429_02354 [Thalassotalea agarivorans]
MLRFKGKLNSALLGASVGLIFVAFWYGINSCETCSNYMVVTLWVDYARLAMWPSAILLVGDPMGTNYALQAVSAVLNVLLFSVLAFLLHLGVRKGKHYITCALFLFCTVYYSVFKLYL